MLARLSACALVLLLGACAAALPGYVPPTSKGKNKFGTPLTSGQMTPDGRYEMSEQEKLMDCKRTTGSILITISHLRHVAKEVPTSEAAKIMNQMSKPFMGGSPRGLDRDSEHARDFARLKAYNQHLVSKSCPPVDIQAELAKAPDPPGTKY